MQIQSVQPNCAALMSASLHGLYVRPAFVFVYQLLEAQADYHRRSLAALEAAIPTIQMQQGEQQDRHVSPTCLLRSSHPF